LQLAAHRAGEAFGLQHQRYRVQTVGIKVLYDAIGGDVAEQADFLADVVVERVFGAQHNQVGLDADAEQLLHTVLGRFCLELAGLAQVGNQGHMGVQYVLAANIRGYLADGLEKRQAFNVADSAADFGDHHVRRVAFGDTEDAILDFIGDVRDHLHRSAQKIPLAFLVEHGPIDFAGGDVAARRKVFIHKPFIMAQIEIRLGSVIGDEHFPMLIGTHGAGIHIDVRVEFLHRHRRPRALSSRPETRL
jgi:hypothetical protein